MTIASTFPGGALQLPRACTYATPTFDPLTFPLLHRPNIYYIYYGSSWSKDTVGQAYLNTLAQYLGGTPWWVMRGTAGGMQHE
jgi:hypothetical protein